MVSRFIILSAVSALACNAVSTADVVIDWNNALLQAIRETGGGPCPMSRKASLVHVSIYEAVNSITRTHEPYHAFESAPAGASIDAAAAQAAHSAMSLLYPGLTTVDIDALLAQHLSAIPDGPSKDAGIAVGGACTNAMMALRADDGSDNNDPYIPGDQPGDWVPTPPNFVPPHAPNWPGVTTWCMNTFDQFRQPGPAGYTSMFELLASPEYVAQFNDVKAYGAADSKVRTEYETETAMFWANDRDGTYKPPGHLFQITQFISADLGLSTAENARLFALVALGMADAGIVAWDMKYSTPIDLWRPITGVREGEFDGNPLTIGDPDWDALSIGWLPSYTPPFPAWVSGHATFGAVHAAIIRNWVNTDALSFTITSDDTPGVFRTYTSLEAAARENGRSRVFLGVHWQWDADDGYIAGTGLGDYISLNFLRRLGDLDGNDHVDGDDVGEFLSKWGDKGGEADLNRDGVVDGADFGILLANWG